MKTLHEFISNILTTNPLVETNDDSHVPLDPEVHKTLENHGLKHHFSSKHDSSQHIYVHSVNHHIRAVVKGSDWHSILKSSVHKGSGAHDLHQHYSNSLKFHKLKKEINPLKESLVMEDLPPDPDKAKYPPPFLTMKRRAVRAFPDGQRVAVYYIAQLKKYISIPFSGGKSGMDIPALSEESLDEAAKPKKKSKTKVKPYDFFKHLKDIAKGGEDKHKPLRFGSGERLKMQPEMAQLILHAHSKLNPMNQAKAHKAMRTNKNLFGRFHTYALGVATVTK